MLHIHRAERADVLVGSLAELLAEPLGPLEPELVAVPSRGVERWLSQRLAGLVGASPGRADGVCANVAFPFPGSLVERAMAPAGGVDPELDPWRPERSVWPLLELVDEALDEAWLAPLARHLRTSEPTRGRRFVTVRHLADLYDRYGVYRPQIVRAWAEGSDEATTPETRWQAELWRRLRTRVEVPSPPERLAQACRALEEDPGLTDLPARFSLFGLTRLAATYLQVLSSLATGRDVHLFLLHPSPALWEAISGIEVDPVLRRADDRTADVPASPLLGSWGRDAREMQLVLAASAARGTDEHLPTPATDGTLLARLQNDVRNDRRPPGVPRGGGTDERAELDPSDRSVQIHGCHSRGRQVEVLRDAVLHLLAEDPTLEPRDIIVMCPDIETFAPLIEATFGATETLEEEDGDDQIPTLRTRLADRSLRQTNPLLGVVGRLLELATARVTASEVLDLATRGPVRQRFAFSDDDLSRIQDWVVGAGVRWGLDGEQRTRFGLERLDANTWRAGLDRLLVGVTMADERQRQVEGVVPLDDVSSGDIDLVGRLCEYVDRVATATGALRSTQPIEAWVTSIAESIDALTEVAERDQWQRDGLRRTLEELTTEASVGDRSAEAPLDLADVIALLEDRLKGRPTRANFRTGHLTICTLVPMRSVPHRVVCLLGLDDGSFPRMVERDGDDLMVSTPHVGDRDPRSEDRQLLLDALMAARDRLVITYTGRDERTNLERPPAVPVGELLDVIDRTVRTSDGTPARRGLVVQHPLQPFDLRNFNPGALAPGRPWSFDPVNLDGARALTRPRAEATPFLPGPLPPVEGSTIELANVSRFLRHPVRMFLRQRLGVRLGFEEDEVDDALPVELDGLEQWGVSERLLGALLAGEELEAFLAAERGRGVLPPGALGEQILDRIVPEVVALAKVAGQAGEPTSLDVDVVLEDGTRLVGTVARIHGDLIRTVTYSRLAPNHRLQAWLQLVALTASRPERAFGALTLGRLRASGPPACTVSAATIEPLGVETAERQKRASAEIEILVDLYRRGMREALPIYSKTSAAWAQAAPAKRHQYAARQWTSDHVMSREDAEPEHQLVLGAKLPFDRLLEDPPRSDESGAGWDSEETSRFGRYAQRVWSRLLERERVEDE